MDIMEMVKQVVGSLTGDKNLLTQFVGDPAKIIKSIIGGDLSNDVIGKIIEGVKDQLGDLLGGADLGKLADTAQGLLGGAAADVKEAADDALKDVKDAAEGAKDAAEEGAGGILGILKKIF